MDYSKLENIPKLKTDNTTGQTAQAAENIVGTINLHKISKTGAFADLIGAPNMNNYATVVAVQNMVDNLDRVKDVTYNSTTGDITFTYEDNTTLIVNVLIKGLIESLDYDNVKKELIITKKDGGDIRVSIADLVDVYTGVEGTQIQVSVSTDNKISAILKAGSIKITDLETALQTKINSIDTAIQSATIGGVAVTKSGTVLELPAYPTDFAPKNQTLAAETGTTDVNITTPAVVSGTTNAILQTIWKKIRSVGNALSSLQTTVTNIVIPKSADLSSQAAAYGQVKRDGTSDDFARADHYHALPAAQNAADVPIKTAINVSTDIGGLTTGSVIPATDSVHDFINKITCKLPTLILNMTNSGDVEYGTNVSSLANPTFTANDGGTVTAYRLKKGGTAAYTGATLSDQTQTMNNFALTTTFVAEVDYAANATTGVTIGTTISNDVTFTPVKKSFCGKIVAVPTTSANIRALTGGIMSVETGLNLKAKSTMTVKLAAGDKGVCFAYPADLKDAESITQDGAFGMLNSFTKTTINVNGANNYTATAYKVYWLLPTFAFEADALFTLTI
jgi:hypothetical protein